MLSENLIEQITQTLIEEKTPAGVEEIVRGTLAYLIETQITNYTYPDPDGGNYCYGDLDDLALDLAQVDEGDDHQWPIHMQIEMREPVCHIQFVNEQPVLLK